jgi:photosystem II stability/assembly factor-like uncharacterized protein
MTRLLALACCTLLLFPRVAGAGTRGHLQSASARDIIPGVVVVKLKPGITPMSGVLSKTGDVLGSAIARLGVKSLSRTFPEVKPPDAKAFADGRVDLSRIYFATVDPGSDVRTIAQRLSALPQIEYAEPKYRQHVTEVPNDTLFPAHQATYFNRLNAVAGWGVAKGSSAVAIADVDGGTYWQHEDLVGNLWISAAEDLNHNGVFDKGAPPAGDEDGIDQDGDGRVDDVIGWNFTNNTNNPRGLPATPGSGAHGTATASHFGAVTNNVTGMAGSSWNCRLMPICAASATSDNSIDFGYEGIQYAYSHGAQIINCSWGRVGAYSQFERDVVVAAKQAGSLIVAAAGNDSINTDITPEYPATFPEVFGIGATNSTNDVKTWFSNYGVNVSVFAPGTNIWSAMEGGGYGNGGSGTSYSSPLVAGLAGIIKSVHPTWTPDQIRAQIRTTADSIDLSNPTFAGTVGRGRANFERALTESHAGIHIVASSVLTPSGRDIFIPGDTVVVTLVVRNILPKTASNLQFSLTSSDAVLQPLSGPVTVSSLAQDAEASLAPMMMTVGPMSGSRIASVAVRWVSNGNERDEYAYRVYLFSSIPRWKVQATPAASSLYSVRAVGATVAWGSGGNGMASAPVVLRTTDRGWNWVDLTGGLKGADFYTIFALDDRHAWVGSGDGRIFATTNGGLSWTQQPYPGTQSQFIDGIWFFDANNGFALGDPATGVSTYVLLKTTNGGVTWTHLSNEPAAGVGEAGWNNSFWWADPQHGWFGTNQFRIHGTSDGGATWVSGPTSSQNSVGVSFRDNLNGVACFDDGYAQITTDGGRSWTLRNKPAQAAQLFSVAFAPGTDAVWTSDGLQAYRSYDAGRTWVAELAYPFDGAIAALSFADSSNGWAATTFGQMLHYQGDTSYVVPPPTGATAFALEQNFPNPFSQTTLIRFTVPSASHVTVTVYDLLGKKVRVIYDGDCPAGQWDVEFSSSGFASGVYFYRMQAGDFDATRKMLVLH